MNNAIATLDAAIANEAETWKQDRESWLTAVESVTLVNSSETLETAGKFEAQGKKLIKVLEAARKKVTSPLDSLKKDIMAQEKSLRREIEAEVARINSMTTAYATELMRQREAELAWIAAEEQARAEAAAANEGSANSLFGLDDPAPAAMPAQPITQGPHTSANRFVEAWDFVVYEPLKVPRELMSVDETKVRAFLKAKKAEGYKADQVVVPGIRISATMRVQSR